MTSETDYLGFGSSFGRMLQESCVSEGPRLPNSIQSISDSIKTRDTTLMRFTLQGRSQEFGISGCQDLRYRRSQDQSGHGTQDQSGHGTQDQSGHTDVYRAMRTCTGPCGRVPGHAERGPEHMELSKRSQHDQTGVNGCKLVYTGAWLDRCTPPWYTTPGTPRYTTLYMPYVARVAVREME